MTARACRLDRLGSWKGDPRRLRRFALCAAMAVFLGSAGCSSQRGTTLPLPETPEASQSTPTVASLEDWSQRYGELLSGCVSRHGLVDYAGLYRQQSIINELVEELAAERAFPSNRHRLAFLINAYNLLVIQGVLDGWPVNSVRQIDGFFEKRRGPVLEEQLSLSELRDVIRSYHDPRIHTALCDAAMSSAFLRSEPYEADRLDHQLHEQAGRFASDPLRNAVISEIVLISPIFKMYAEDFMVEPYTDPLVFLRIHADPQSPLGRLVRRRATPPLEFQEFNWALNAR